MWQLVSASLGISGELCAMNCISFCCQFHNEDNCQKEEEEEEEAGKPERKTLVAATRTRPRQCQSASADVHESGLGWVSWDLGLGIRASMFVCLSVCQLSGPANRPGNKISNKMKWLQTLAAVGDVILESLPLPTDALHLRAKIYGASCSCQRMPGNRWSWRMDAFKRGRIQHRFSFPFSLFICLCFCLCHCFFLLACRKW